jgi:hypothetical protein
LFHHYPPKVLFVYFCLNASFRFLDTQRARDRHHHIAIPTHQHQTSIFNSSFTSYHINPSTHHRKMLRRAPTTITLTSTDVEQYESNRARKLWEQQQQQQAASSTDGSENGKQDALEQSSQRQKSRKDRIMGHGH